MTAALLVFLSVFALDFVWTFYTRSMVDRREVRASLWAAALIGLAGLAQSEYVKDKTLLFPAALGAFAGTWLSMKLEQRRKKQHDQQSSPAS